MSKQICNAAGGSLEVFSQLMTGSNFKFTMATTPATDLNSTINDNFAS